MPAFEYTAFDVKGTRRTGVLEGDSQRQIRQMLREQGLIPSDARELTLANTQRTQRWRGGANLTTAELALFTRQLATLLRAGAPLEEALANIAQQQRKRSAKRVVAGVRSRVVEGYSLAMSFESFPQAFNDLFCATVAAGEEAGHLDAVLERLADHVEMRQATEQRIQAALIYPLVLSFVAVMVLVGLLVYVVPGVVDVFQNMQRELPWLTQVLLNLSAWLQAWWWIVLAAITVMGIAWNRALRREQFRHGVDAIALRLPVVGNLYQGVSAARFARTFSILAGSGVSILNALEIAGRVIPCLPMRHAVANTANKVREGGLIWKALETSHLFPPMMIYLIANGEASGELGIQLERAAAQQERETDSALTTLMALFEPLLILVMGGLVLMIVLAILLPIFELNQMVGI